LVTQITLDGSSSSTGANYDVKWTTVGGNFVSGQNTLQPVVNKTGTYMLEVTDITNSCKVSTTVTVIDIIQKPKAKATAAATLTCILKSTQVNGTGSETGPDIRYKWTTSNGKIKSGDSSLVATVDFQGWYYLLVTNLANGCTNKDSVQVQSDPSIPSPSVSVSDPRCFGDCNGKIIIDTVVGGKAPYLYSLDGKVYTTNRNFQNLCPNTYNVKVQDLNGCIVDAPSLKINPKKQISVGISINNIDTTITLGDTSLILTAKLGGTDTSNVQSIIWTPEGDSTCFGDAEVCLSRKFKLDRSTLIKVKLIDKNGCIAEDSKRINVDKFRPVYIPNVFTPDGVNNTFFIRADQRQVKQIRSLQIFDRWGEQMFLKEGFQPNDISGGWDGRYRGVPMNPAVFVYWAEIEFIDGKVILYEGDLTLLR
jgi:gliding motility-associated-like protein